MSKLFSLTSSSGSWNSSKYGWFKAVSTSIRSMGSNANNLSKRSKAPGVALGYKWANGILWNLSKLRIYVCAYIKIINKYPSHSTIQTLTLSLPIRLNVTSSGVPRIYNIWFNWSTTIVIL